MAEDKRVTGYGFGEVDSVISVDDVAREARRLADAGPSPQRLAELANDDPLMSIDRLVAGYGKMEILHGFGLQIARGQSLCLIGPNGAGKSTVLHSIYGFTNIIGGTITLGDTDVTRLSPNQKLRAGIAYILQDN